MTDQMLDLLTATAERATEEDLIEALCECFDAYSPGSDESEIEALAGDALCGGDLPMAYAFVNAIDAFSIDDAETLQYALRAVCALHRLAVARAK